MKPALLAIFLLLAAGCGEPDREPDRTLYYRQSVDGLSVDERMHIVQTLESNGWTDVEFLWDFGDVVVARKIVDKQKEGATDGN